MMTLIKNGRIIDPANNTDVVADLYIENGVIAEANNKATIDKTIDASGKWVVPGFIDINTELREPGYEHKATIQSETKAAVKAGFTSLCCSPNTKPVLDSTAVVRFILDKSAEAGFAKVLPTGALTIGLDGKALSEMNSLHKAGCVAMNQAANSNMDAATLRGALLYAETFNIPVILKAEDASIRGQGCVHDGSVSSRLGLPGISPSAETVAIAQIIALLEETNARVHITGLSTAKGVAMIASAQRAGLKITADTHAHQLHLTEQDMLGFDANYHLNPPLRTAEDRDALIEGVAKGVISAVSSGHQPHQPDAKLAPFPSTAAGISSLETVLPLMLELVQRKLLSEQQMIACLSQGPAELLGLSVGSLSVGKAADICIIDPLATWQAAGDLWQSAGLNSPYFGQQMIGQVSQTLVNGKLVFEK